MGEKEQGSIGEHEARSPFSRGMRPPAEEGIATKPVQVVFQRTSGQMGASDPATGDQGTVEDEQ